jgi:hypothetical protein
VKSWNSCFFSELDSFEYSVVDDDDDDDCFNDIIFLDDKEEDDDDLDDNMTTSVTITIKLMATAALHFFEVSIVCVCEV